jgi:hypothetical protein
VGSERYREPRDDEERYWQRRAREMGIELRYVRAEPGTHILLFFGPDPELESLDGED